MKKAFLATVLILISAFAFGQEESTVLKLSADKQYSYEKVFEVPGKSKSEIFDAIKSWVITNIKSQANTNYFDDKAMSITTTPAFSCSFSSWVDFKLNIEIKDGKYRVTCSSFVWHNMQGIAKSLGDYSGIYMKKKAREQVMADVDKNFNGIIESIQNSTAKKSDW